MVAIKKDTLKTYSKPLMHTVIVDFEDSYLVFIK